MRLEYYQKFIKVWFIKSQKWKIKIKNSASYLGYKAGYGALRLVQSHGSAHSCHRTQDWSFTACH